MSALSKQTPPQYEVARELVWWHSRMWCSRKCRLTVLDTATCPLKQFPSTMLAWISFYFLLPWRKCRYSSSTGPKVYLLGAEPVAIDPEIICCKLFIWMVSFHSEQSSSGQNKLCFRIHRDWRKRPNVHYSWQFCHSKCQHFVCEFAQGHISRIYFAHAPPTSMWGEWGEVNIHAVHALKIKCFTVYSSTLIVSILRSSVPKSERNTLIFPRMAVKRPKTLMKADEDISSITSTWIARDIYMTAHPFEHACRVILLQ